MQPRPLHRAGVLLPGKWLLITFVCLLAIFVSGTQDTVAQDTVRTMESVNVNTNFTCVGPNPSGRLFSSSAVGGGVAPSCATGFNPITRTMCVFEDVLSQVMGKMYCALQDALRQPMQILMTLFVTLFGVMFITGMINFTAKEVVIALFKIALIWGFATNAELGIQVGYNFFMSLAKDGVRLMLAGVSGGLNLGGGGDLYGASDTGLSRMATVFSGQDDPTGALNIPPTCRNTFIIVAILLFLFVPPLALIVLIVAITWLSLFFRAVFGYLYALMMITLLFVMAPLFLAFALFSTTRDLFENWVAYLISHSLQLMIVFGFFAFIASVDIANFLYDILAMLRPWNKDITIGGIGWNINICSICKHTANVSAQGTQVITSLTCVPDNPANPNEAVLSPFAWTTQWPFMLFVVSKSLSLFVLGWVLEHFLKIAPELAQQLAGGTYTGVLGGAKSPGQTTGSSGLYFVGEHAVGSGIEGFKQSYKDAARWRHSPFGVSTRRAMSGMKGGWAAFRHGQVDTLKRGGLIEKMRGFESSKERYVEAAEKLKNAKSALQEQEALACEGKGNDTELNAARLKVKEGIEELNTRKQERRQAKEEVAFAKYFGYKQQNPGVFGDLFQHFFESGDNVDDELFDERERDLRRSEREGKWNFFLRG